MNEAVRFYRITALWVVSETFLGGFLHALKLPTTGFFLAGFAALCMSLLFYHKGKAEDILRALLLVLVFKMMLSPHAPLGAFLSVGLQGLAGYTFFKLIPSFGVAAFAVAIFAYLQSALMRLFMLTIVFGMEFWAAVDAFTRHVLGLVGFSAEVSYVSLVIGSYVLFYLSGGIFAGFICAGIAKWYSPLQFDFKGDEEALTPKRKKRKWILPVVLGGIIFGIWMTDTADGQLGGMLMRAAIIILFWYVIVAPLSKKLIFGWLKKRKSRFTDELDAITALLPEIRRIVIHAWKESRKRRGLYRFTTFLQLTVRYSL